MGKISRTFHEIVEERRKAVRLRINADDRNSVWFPKHRIELDRDARTVAATKKLWEEQHTG